jgi:pimeloyl-ACP methyl ester carboxylesterase
VRASDDDDPAGNLRLTPTIAPSSSGVAITIHDLGGDGPPLLLCHATGFHGRVWQPVADRLPDRRCFAPDLRGHGDSPVRPGLSLQWKGFADDVLAVIDTLGLSGVAAAGHSKGGAALLLAEQARPGTFRALYCYEPVVVPTAPTDPAAAAAGPNALAEGALRRRPTFDSYAAAYANFAAKPPFSILDPDALRAYVQYGFREEADGSVTIKCRPEVESEIYSMGARHAAFARLGEIQCPVTVARGALAPGSPGAMAETIVEALPNGTLEDHPDLGHFGPLEDPATIAGCIDTALSQAEPHRPD